MVSIVIPAYNAEKYISETIDSVINQSYNDWELIVVNDGSSDQTKQIIDEFCTKDNRIRYYYQENSGVSNARNRGIELSKGKYIAFLDADDIWLESNLKEKVKTLELNSDIYWVFSNIIYFTPTNDHVEELTKNDKKVFWLDSILQWRGEVKTTPSNIVIKKDCCIEGGVYFDPKFSTAADQEFCMQLAAKYKGKYIDKPLIRYRVLENSMSSNIAVMETDQLGVYIKALKNGYFKSYWFKQRCFSKLYWILAGSWWKDGNSKKRGFYFIFRALIADPFSIKKVFNKSLK